MSFAIGARNPHTFLELTSDPTAISDSGHVYTNDISGATELMYLDDSGNETQMTSGGLASIFDGGNTTGANITIGTNDTFALLFETDGNEVARFLTTGEFVLGATALVVAADITLWKKDQNAASTFRVLNATNGTAAASSLQARGPAIATTMGVYSPLFTPSEGINGNDGWISASGGLDSLVIHKSGTGSIRFVTNSGERARILTTGEFLIGRTTSSTAGTLLEVENGVTGNSGMVITNTSTAGIPGFIVTAGAVSFRMGQLGSTSSPLSGIAAGRSFVKGGGPITIQTDGSDNIEFETNQILAMSIQTDQTVDFVGSCGFNGTAAPAQPAAYTVTNVVTDRTYDADATSTGEIADVLGTLIADLQSYGLLQ